MSTARASDLRRARRGLTLIEVVLAIAILVLLFGGMFGTVRMALRTSTEIEDGELRTRAFASLFRLCDRTFTTLPAEATLFRGASKGGFAAQAGTAEIVFRNAPSAFAIDDADFFFGEVALVVRRQVDGDLILGSEYRRIDRQTGQTLPKPRWIPLLRNLRSVEWSFFDPRTGRWQDIWTDSARHPLLARLTIAPADGYPKQTAVFWIPPIAAGALSPTPSPVSNSAAPAS